MKKKEICRYCDSIYTVQGKTNTKHPNTCGKCIQKLPLAHKFTEVCNEIKMKVYKDKKKVASDV